jgi:hypothetical protein
MKVCNILHDLVLMLLISIVHFETAINFHTVTEF